MPIARPSFDSHESSQSLLLYDDYIRKVSPGWDTCHLLGWDVSPLISFYFLVKLFSLSIFFNIYVRKRFVLCTGPSASCIFEAMARTLIFPVCYLPRTMDFEFLTSIFIYKNLIFVFFFLFALVVCFIWKICW